MWFKNSIFAKKCILINNITIVITSHFIFVPCCGFFQYYQGVKEFGSDQARYFVGSDLGPNCSRQQKSPLASKELNTKQLVDTTFWLKSWLKLISFGYNFFHLAEVLATTNSEPGYTLI